MKKYILVIALSLGMLPFLKAQDDNGTKRAEKIQALKIAFITQKLGLTSEEAQKFWPVYGQYENDVRSLLGDNKNSDVIDNEERLVNIKKKYRPEFAKVLGQPRMNKLFTAEKEFRGVLLQGLKNRNNQQRPLMRQR
ncbi:MAG: hypothetical protein ABIN97_15920 [Ginsengibacter sp.]